ncbi:DUF4327 family protein [Pantanalinema rosaneae CENA516]|uniref:DUF4327 family protein n=1 Tax=Pantanalinema rosaneae TaxID=1620701 RepID=UPI003D6EA981
MPLRYSLSIIQDEARYLLQQGIVSRRQPIYTLGKYIPAREWSTMEHALAEHEFLLRDRIGDLVPSEEWSND